MLLQSCLELAGLYFVSLRFDADLRPLHELGGD